MSEINEIAKKAALPVSRLSNIPLATLESFFQQAIDEATAELGDELDKIISAYMMCDGKPDLVFEAIAAYRKVANIHGRKIVRLLIFMDVSRRNTEVIGNR